MHHGYTVDKSYLVILVAHCVFLVIQLCKLHSTMDGPRVVSCQFNLFTPVIADHGQLIVHFFNLTNGSALSNCEHIVCKLNGHLISLLNRR